MYKIVDVGTSDLKWSMAGDPKFKIFFTNFHNFRIKSQLFPTFVRKVNSTTFHTILR